MSSLNKTEIATPHAAVLVWNYNDRISGDVDGTIDEEGINFQLISTVSCISIQTSKSKGSPAGSFQLVLAPFKNWVSTLTAGSWCAILMSNKPITEKDVKVRANLDQVKMFGKIETVRVDVSTNPADGSRQTRFLVSGTDWGHIFNNVLYIDNLINATNDPATLGNSAAVAIRNALMGKGNTPKSFSVADNLTSLLNIFGNNLEGFTEAGKDINRLAKSSYDFILPKEVANYFKFVGPKGDTSRVITRLLKLQTGKLISYNKYKEISDSFGYIDPFSLQGTNTFWQILLDNSNPTLNEMYCEMEWDANGPQLVLYNRIKPFSFKKTSNFVSSSNALRSSFLHIKTHKLDPISIISINAGTNWRDKYNFIEIKPQFSDFAIYGNWIKTKSQVYDEAAFNREGFRPFITGTKQFPVSPDSSGKASFEPEQLTSWTKLLSEWYFDTHRLLNGTLTMTGQNEYIAVGNNIKFPAELINPTPNINSKTNKDKKNKHILAHVENVNHSFSISEEGARSYITTIQFVRGIIVNDNNSLVGEGSLDQYNDEMTQTQERNLTNTITVSDIDDPDPEKVDV